MLEYDLDNRHGVYAFAACMVAWVLDSVDLRIASTGPRGESHVLNIIPVAYHLHRRGDGTYAIEITGPTNQRHEFSGGVVRVSEFRGPRP
jgi:hypothetical protein